LYDPKTNFYQHANILGPNKLNKCLGLSKDFTLIFWNHPPNILWDRKMQKAPSQSIALPDLGMYGKNRQNEQNLAILNRFFDRFIQKSELCQAKFKLELAKLDYSSKDLKTFCLIYKKLFFQLKKISGWLG
jgi:hypothetical protein